MDGAGAALSVSLIFSSTPDWWHHPTVLNFDMTDYHVAVDTEMALASRILKLVCAALVSIAVAACTDDAAPDPIPRDAMVDSQADAAGDHVNGEPDTGRLGADQCPLSVDGTCPDGCTDIPGAKVDVQAECRMASSVVDCTTREGFPDEVDCRVSIATGDVFSIPFLALGGEGFLGWRDCSEQDRLVAVSAPSCQ